MEKDDKRINLLSFTRPELRRWFQEELGQPPFRADQVWQWIWRKQARDFECMSNVSKSLRNILTEIACIRLPRVAASETGADGTRKLLLELSDGAAIETVLIPAPNRVGEIRWSQCLSTQVGCPMQCAFCATGQMGFRRNLELAEIVGQVLLGREALGDCGADQPILRNLVFMGMGEPLLNLDTLLRALESLNDGQGANFSPRRITVSTCGIENGLQRLGESGLAWLAVSLHAANQELRARLMPKAASWKLDALLENLEKYPLKTRERITFEYLLLGGVNDSISHARELARVLSRIKAKINLIRYNPVPGLPFESPSEESVAAFQKFLCAKNITAILRKSRGADIAAACGQLATAGALAAGDF